MSGEAAEAKILVESNSQNVLKFLYVVRKYDKNYFMKVYRFLISTKFDNQNRS